ncbi:hypothetical protein ASG44_11620 [Methylophilus sp. Leaf459]|nr:hypothetical protein ASG34_10065 [Methylophilus sp. Leaf416]KQT58316.1 hypothetical protein ASG44_11620 [Methylophilus sp. Leaf459]
MKAPAEVSAKRHILAAIVSVEPILPRMQIIALRGTCSSHIPAFNPPRFWRIRKLCPMFTALFAASLCWPAPGFYHA